MENALSREEIEQLKRDSHLQAYAFGVGNWQKFHAMTAAEKESQLEALLEKRGRALDNERREWEESWQGIGIPG